MTNTIPAGTLLKKKAIVTLDRDMIGARYGIFNPTENRLYVSQAMYSILTSGDQREKELMTRTLRVIDLGIPVEVS